MFERRFCPSGGDLPDDLPRDVAFWPIGSFLRSSPASSSARSSACSRCGNAQVLGTDQFPAPAAQTWSAVAKALGHGLSSLEPVKLWLILAGGVVGAVLTDGCGAGVLGQRRQHSQDARRRLAGQALSYAGPCIRRPRP